MAFSAENYQKIVEKIKQLETDLARTEGQKSQILQELKSTFKVDSLEAAEKLLTEMQAEHAILVQKQEEQFKKLEGLTNWSAL